jgi:hypothetical protein
MLVRSSNSDKLSNRIVHVSVQLFSNEELALQVSILSISVSPGNFSHNLLPSKCGQQFVQKLQTNLYLAIHNTSMSHKRL